MSNFQTQPTQSFNPQLINPSPYRSQPQVQTINRPLNAPVGYQNVSNVPIAPAPVTVSHPGSVGVGGVYGNSIVRPTTQIPSQYTTSILRGSSVSQTPVQVFRAPGPPVPPPVASNVVRISDKPSLPSRTDVVRSTKYIDGGVVYESRLRDQTAPDRQNLNELYASKGYIEPSKKCSPCLLALLGFLALLGLLTGLYFIIKAINAGHSHVEQPNDIDFEENNNGTINNNGYINESGTNGNSSINGSTNGINGNANSTSPVSPIIIEPTPIENNSTTINDNRGVNGTDGTQNSVDLLKTDQNAQRIDQFLRSQDAYRLGNDPNLQKIEKKYENGKDIYYFTYKTGTGKEYIYGATISQNGEPEVQSVNVIQTQHLRHRIESHLF